MARRGRSRRRPSFVNARCCRVGPKAKYQTFGGPEGQSGYDEGPTSELGRSNLRYHDDGKITVGGEEVENPDDEFRGEPIPGGPTDDRTRDSE